MRSRRIRNLAAGFAVASLLGCRPNATPVVVDGLDEKLQALAQAFFENGDFSGFVAVSRDGEVVGEAAVGFADWARTKAHDRHTSFHVASISKTFTAAAIRQLVAQELVSFDEPLSAYLPEFPEGDRMTIRHLLEHQSGVPDYWSLLDVGEYASRPTPLSEMVTWLGSKPLDFAPGSGDAYSNSGYALLAAVIEVASGQTYHDYLVTNLFPAAQLEETGRYMHDADASGFVPAHGDDGLKPSAPYDPTFLIGAGSLKSTASDLLTWCDVFIADFLDGESAEAVYGWGARQENGRRHAEQTGRNPGFSTHLRAYPDSRVCVVVLSNIESESVAALGAGASAIAFGESVTPPAKRPSISLPREEQAAYVGRFEIYPGRNLEVLPGESGLLLRGRNGPLLPLEMTGDDSFFYRQLYTAIDAERDDEGRVSALLWGGSARLPRVD